MLLGETSDIAIAGQSRRLTADQYRQLADQMLAFNNGMAAISSTVVAIIELAERESTAH